MLNKDLLLDKMKLHFARWMDIRKRVKSSNGGKYLQSISETIEDINDAISSYKKDFFIDGYYGKEELVLDIVHKINIGKIDLDSFSVIQPDNLIITTDINVFSNNLKYLYYNNGIVYIRNNDCVFDENNNAILKYTINSIEFNAIMTKYHVWNVFDEFATFVGIKRHDNETNKELEYRIIHVNDDKVNSSINGLKKSIINELIVYDPNIDMDDIKIEPVTPSNLYKYYNDFEKVIDHLMNINKDVYKTKVWDTDLWEHNMAQIDYLPHAWDEAIIEYQNGIGDNDDLKVTVTDQSSSTNATISLYSKNKESIIKYFRDSNKQINIPFSLKRFTDVYNEKNVKYRITAAELKDITNLPIYFLLYADKNNIVKKDIEDILYPGNIINDINIVDNTILSNNEHIISFYPDNNKVFVIDKCSITNTKTLENNNLLLNINNNNFIIKNNYLLNKECKLYIDNVFYINDKSNVINSGSGIKIKDIDSIGEMNIDLPNNLNNDKLKICIDDTISDIISNTYVSTNFQKGLKEYISSNQNDTLNISGNFNYLNFDCLGNNYFINGTVNGISINKFYIENTTFKTDKFLNPVYMNITIKNLSNKLILSDIKYNKFNTTMSLLKGSIIDNIISNEQNNKLNITIKSLSTISPVIKYIYVGGDCNNILDIHIDSSIDNRKINIDSICTKTLFTIKDNVKILDKENYNPEIYYEAISDNSYIKLNIDANNTSIVDNPIGQIKILNNNTYLFLNKGDIIKYVYIEEHQNTLVAKKSLNSIINIETNDKIYTSSLFDGIILIHNNNQSIIHITKDLITVNQTYSGFEVQGLNDDISVSFKISENNYSQSNYYNSNFEEICFIPKNNTKYVAINEYQMFSQEESNIEIINTFYPVIDIVSDMYLYTVESLTDNVQVFMNNNDTFSVGINTVSIINNDYINNTINFIQSLNNNVVSSNFDYENNYLKLEDQYESNGIILNTNECVIIPPENSIVHYKKRSIVNLEQGIIVEPEFYFSSEIIITNDLFNKLKHANIDEILYIGNTPWTINSYSNINSNNYSVLYNEGIIKWNNKDMIGDTVYIVYCIKIPDYIDIDINLLYQQSNYVLEGYKLQHQFLYANLQVGEHLNLNNYNEYKFTDKILIECSEPGFTSTIKNGIITIEKIYDSPKIAVHTGYFYENREEYYFFNSASYNNKIIDTKEYKVSNVDDKDGQLLFHEKSMNMINNSALTPNYLFNTMNINAMEGYIKGISCLNNITACDNLSFWHSIGQSLKLVPGYNDIGIEFSNIIKDGYSFIEITAGCIQNIKNTISLYARGDNFNIFIGRERKIDNFSANQISSIDILLQLNKLDNNIFYTQFIPDDFKYYLIIQGTCTIDDIILSDNDNFIDIHEKNIDKLNMSIQEITNTAYEYEIILNELGAIFDKLEFNNNTFKVSASLSWNLTQLSYIHTKEDYESCEVNNLICNDNFLYTNDLEAGYIITSPIYIGNKNNINKIIISVNNILFESMKNLETIVYTCDNLSNDFKQIVKTFNNYIEITPENLSNYIRIKTNVNINKILESISIYVEYKQNGDTTPASIIYNNGTYLSRVFDLQEQGNYKVKDIDILSVKNINNIKIYIRGARKNYDNIFLDWQEINLDDNNNIRNDIEFNNIEYVQVKIELNSKNSEIKINKITLEMI